MPDGPPIDMEKMNDATADLMKLLGGDKRVGRTAVQKLDAEAEAIRERNRTPSERAEKAAQQEAHASKIRSQRAESERKEVAAEAERRLRVQQHASGTMGIGRVPVNVGDVKAAYEYEIHFDTVELILPLPAHVTRARQLVVDVGVRCVSVGLKGHKPYLQGQFKGRVRKDDTVWMVESPSQSSLGELKIELVKAVPGEHWPGVLDLPRAWRCQWAEPVHRANATELVPSSPYCSGPCSSATEANLPADDAPGAASCFASKLAACRDTLLLQGYAIIDDALTTEQANVLSEEMQGLHSAGALRQHRFGFKPGAVGEPRIYEKPGIFEAELTDTVCSNKAPLC